MSALYEVSRGSRSWTYDTEAELVRAIQNGLVDGADRVFDAESGLEGSLEEHPRFRDELIDEEVMGEEEPDIEVDLTPMIDVTFLLLIFFMATTMIVMFKTLEAPGSKTESKGNSTRKVPTRSEVEARYLFVKVNEDGRVVIAGQQAIGLTSIRDTLAKAMTVEGKRTIVIEAMGKVRHGDVVQVIDAANQAKADKILFARKVAPGK